MREAQKSFRVIYWPVGQGLFSSVDISVRNASSRVVYDCGSAAWDPRTALEREIHPPADLLVISHFHWDHIAGIPGLVKQGAPKAAWVPYVAPRHRVLYAASVAAHGAANEVPLQGQTELLRFTINPREWLQSQGVREVHEIGGPEEGGGDGPPPLVPPEFPRQPSGPEDDERGPEGRSLTIGPPRSWPGAFDAGSGFHASWARVTGRAAGAPFPVADLLTWVRPLGDTAMETLAADAASFPTSFARDKLLRMMAPDCDGLAADDALILAEAINDPSERKFAGQLYGALQQELNATSLFLVLQASRITEPTRPDALCPCWRPPYPLYSRCDLLGGPWCPSCWYGPPPPCPQCEAEVRERARQIAMCMPHQKLYPTVLWSGDAPTGVLNCLLKGGGASDALAQRLSATSLWQVAHHGAGSSLSPRFYDAIAPAGAVISCGLHNTYGHPNLEVLQSTRATLVTEDFAAWSRVLIWR